MLPMKEERRKKSTSVAFRPETLIDIDSAKGNLSRSSYIGLVMEEVISKGRKVVIR